MNTWLKKRSKRRLKRTLRVRKSLISKTPRSRLFVNKTNTHIHVQIIDPQGDTIANVSTLSKEFRDTEFNKKNKKSAHQLGIRIAELAKEKGVDEVIFDRARFKYHGILAEVAAGARDTGLQF